MSQRLYSTISFKSAIVCCFLLCGCLSDLSTSGSSSSNSNASCPGEGGLFPTPVAPQSHRDYKKLSIDQKSLQNKSGSLFLLAQTPLVAIVNEPCVLSQNSRNTPISQLLREQISSQKSHTTERAYSLKLKDSVTLQQLEQMTAQDSCLISLGEDVLVTPSATSVNDPGFSSLTHLTAIHASDAWDTFFEDLTGTVTLAVIDDGIDMTHQDLNPILWVNPGEVAGNGIDDDGNGYVDDINGYNFASSLASPAHEAGTSHGSHVAGLSAAIDNNNIGITGVMGRNVRIMVLNVFGSAGTSSAANIVNALNYARSKGAHVINMSLGGLGSADTVNTAMINAVASGSFIAVAAGNDNTLVTDTTFYMPMGYAKDIEGAISVGSVDALSLQRSSFSNYSTTYVEIAAPGSDSNTGGLLSTVPTNSYNYKQGTSMASPVVAGAAALLVGWAQSRGITLTPAQIESSLKSSADASGSLAPYFMGGALLNLSNLASATLCF